MKKIKYGILIAVCILVIVWGFFSIGRTIIIKYTGEKVIAVVKEIPSSCDRYNHIKVLLDGVNYEVSISRNNCKMGTYKVGQKVELLRNKNYEELIWPDSYPEFVPLLIIAAFALVYISIKGRHNKSPKN